MNRRTIAFIVFIVIALIISIAIIMAPGKDPGEDQGAVVDHEGSVETAISVEHADSTHDVILTSHKVWVRNNIYSTILHRDTVPTLDSLNTTAEDASGNTQNVRLKKDYQIFITVK
jgi:hypothetical protein